MTKNIFFRLYGKGFPVVLLHGFLGNSDQWIEFGRVLSPHFQIIIPDLPNHGSSFHTNKLNLEETASILLNFIEEAGLEKIILLGHSWGGKIAMKMVHEKPELFSKLIAVDISSKKYPFSEEWASRINLLEVLCQQNFTNFKELEVYLSPFYLEKWEQALLLKNFTRKNGLLICKSNVEVLIRDFSEIFREVEFNHPIEIPTLFLKGENSAYISDEEFPFLQKQFPLMMLGKIKGATHCPHLENPTDFSSAIEKFILS